MVSCLKQDILEPLRAMLGADSWRPVGNPLSPLSRRRSLTSRRSAARDEAAALPLAFVAEHDWVAKMLIENLSVQAVWASEKKFKETRGVMAAVRSLSRVAD